MSKVRTLPEKISIYEILMQRFYLVNGSVDKETTALQLLNSNLSDVNFFPSEVQDSGLALLDAPNIASGTEATIQVRTCTNIDIDHPAIYTGCQPGDKGRMALRSSARKKSSIALTSAPQTPVRARKGQVHHSLKVKQEEDTVIVLSEGPCPSSAEMQAQAGSIPNYIDNEAALPVSGPFSSSIAEARDMNSPGTWGGRTRKRNVQAKNVHDTAVVKIKRIKLEESIRLHDIPPLEVPSDTIIVNQALRIATTGISVSALGKKSKKGISARSGLQAKQNPLNTTDETVVATLSQSKSTTLAAPSKAKSKSLIKKQRSRAIPKSFKSRAEELRRHEQRIMFSTARTVNQPIKAITKELDGKPRARSAPAGLRRLGATLDVKKQHEPMPLAGAVRALSEAPEKSRAEVNVGNKTRRSRSTPPTASYTRNSRLKICEVDSQIRASEENDSRKGRARSVGAIPAFPQPNMWSIHPNIPKNGKKLKNFKARGLRLPKESPSSGSKRKKAAKIASQKKDCTQSKASTMTIALTDIDFDLSDALDISDSGTSLNEDGFPYQLSQKLERAKQRPRLELIQRNKLRFRKKIAIKRRISQPKESLNGGEESTGSIPYDPRIFPGALTYDEGRHQWMVPASCYR